MPIVFVNWQLNDIGWEVDLFWQKLLHLVANLQWRVDQVHGISLSSNTSWQT